jgi:hypothetical protein
MKPMLNELFGNESAARVLLHIFHYGEIHGAAIASDYKSAISPIQKQLERFERAGILVSKLAGRTRVYSFNPKSPFLAPVKRIVEIIYENIPLNEREKLFGVRRRPRAPGKKTTR